MSDIYIYKRRTADTDEASVDVTNVDVTEVDVTTIDCIKVTRGCTGIVLVVTIILSIIVTVVLYIVFGIIALVNNKNTADLCDNSYLWYYVLVSIIFAILGKSGEAKVINTNNDNVVTSAGVNSCIIVCCLIIELSGNLGIY